MSGTATASGEQTFLAELLWPGVTVALAIAEADRLARAAGDLRRAGRRVVYLRGSLIPADETLFLWFHAPSASCVAEMGRQTGALFDRISLVIDLPQPVSRQSRLDDTEP
jgi:hypothetical protein